MWREGVEVGGGGSRYSTNLLNRSFNNCKMQCLYGFKTLCCYSVQPIQIYEFKEKTFIGMLKASSFLRARKKSHPDYAWPPASTSFTSPSLLAPSPYL